MQIQAGEGSDGDTLGKALVWLYDTKDYPFFQVCQQNEPEIAREHIRFLTSRRGAT